VTRRFSARLRVLHIVGPDGSGKTTIGTHLSAAATAEGLVVDRIHHRPRLLPGGSRQQGDVTRPHNVAARGGWAARAKLLLVWLDWQFFYWRRILRHRHRSELVLVERGWWDMVVDPVRYRLPPDVANLTIRLGRLLPRADAVALLTGQPHLIQSRKPEISADEVARQLEQWQLIAPTVAGRCVSVDTVQNDASTVAHRLLEALAPDPNPLTGSWRRAPLTHRARDVRWTGSGDSCVACFPRPYGFAARAALPVRRALSMLWLGGVVAGPFDVNQLAESLGVQTDGAVVVNSAHPGRLVTALTLNGRVRYIVKLGAHDDAGLVREAELVASLQGPATDGIAPTLHWAGYWQDWFALSTEAVDTSTRPILDLDVITRVCTRLVAGIDGAGPVVHGDLAPWNIVGRAGRPTLVDWEFSRRQFMPLADLAHFVVACGARLRSWQPREAGQLLVRVEGPGWRHLADVGEDPRSAPHILECLFTNSVDIRASRERAFWRQMMKTLMARGDLR